MQLPVTRRLRPREEGPIGPLALLGFGVGIAAGFLLSECFGQSGRSRVSRLLGGIRRRPGEPVTLQATAARIETALAGEGSLRLEGVASRLAGGQGIALHGWAPDRATRTRAWRLAQSVAGAVPVLNRLLVRGEDDRPAETGLADARRSA
jgi:hypothetical protein